MTAKIINLQPSAPDKLTITLPRDSAGNIIAAEHINALGQQIYAMALGNKLPSPLRDVVLSTTIQMLSAIYTAMLERQDPFNQPPAAS